MNYSHFGSSPPPQNLGDWRQDHGNVCATRCTTAKEEKRPVERHGQIRRDQRELHDRQFRWGRWDNGREEQ
eukprot:3549189-Heterocapsa_arctica.AAC.1